MVIRSVPPQGVAPVSSILLDVPVLPGGVGSPTPFPWCSTQHGAAQRRVIDQLSASSGVIGCPTPPPETATATTRPPMKKETTLTPTERTVGELVAPIIDDLEVQLYDLELVGGVLRILLDKPGGIDMGSLTEATRRISRALDAADPISSTYTLEVSSPGIERNLRLPSHFVGAIGERVKVKTHPDAPTDRRFDGVLETFDDPVVGVRVDNGSLVTLTLDQIERVRTQFVDTAAPKPGKGPRKPAGRPADTDDDAPRSEGAVQDPDNPNSKTRSETKP